MLRVPREREARYLQLTIQRLGDSSYIPHLLTHAVSTLDTGLSTISSGWDAATTKSQQIIIQTVNEYIFGARRSKWREIFRTKGPSALREWLLSASTSPQKREEKLQKHWKFWEQHCPGFLL